LGMVSSVKEDWPVKAKSWPVSQLFTNLLRTPL
jgi:hypothetical protein